MTTKASSLHLCIWGYVLLSFLTSVVCEPKAIAKNMNFQLVNMRDYEMKPSDYASWQSNCCMKFRSLLMKKEYAMQKLGKAVKTMVRSTNMSEQSRKYYVSTFKVFQKELHESEHLIFQSIAWLNKALQGDLKDVINIQESSKARLEALRDATLKEEQEYNAILEAEKHHTDGHKVVIQNHTSSIISMIGDILQEVSQVADKLETDLTDHVFDREKNRVKGRDIETVVKMPNEEEEIPANNNMTKRSVEQGVMKLVDPQENQYVLSKSKDSTVPQEDPNLIMDVVYIVITAYVFGFICDGLHIPAMFGYIMSGIVLGPPLCNVLKSVVQLETLGEFGVFFILFSVGLEFSPDKLKKVFRIATVSSVCMMLVTILLLVSLGHVVGAIPLESAFIGASLSLSSTPLVVRFLSSPKDSTKSEVSSGMDYGTVLLGVLIMQDVLLGLLMAVLPRVAITVQPNTTLIGVLILYIAVVLKLIAALLVVLAGCWLASTFVIGPLYNLLHSKGSKELTVLATVTLVFLVMMVTDYVNVSMELGSFLAGVMLSAQGGHLAEKIEALIQPLKDFLSVIFFASIGLHIFPTFLISEITMLMSLTFATVISKFVVSTMVLAFTLPSGNSQLKWIVSAGLAQVSEFSFVLGSRARLLNIISREVYLLILSVTTLSLLLAPVLWNAVLWQLHLRKSHSRTRQHSPP